MSWSIQEEWSGQTTGVSIESDGVKGTTDVTRTFNLTPNFSGATTVDALAAAGLPLRNSAHPQNPVLRARQFNASQLGPQYFQVTVGYQALTSDPNDPSQNPLAQPAVVSFSSVTQEVEIDEDVNGDPIETVNGEPLVGVTRPFTDLVITVSRNLPTFNPVSISTYMNKVNSATWYGLPAGTVRIMDIQAQNQFSEDFEFWAVTISFQVRRGYGSVTDAKAWWHRCAHQGYIIKQVSPAAIGYAKADPADDFTDGGTTVAQPVMLDLTTGERLASGTGAYIDFQVLETIDFNTLNLL
jgi:hypothetical protein